MPARNRETLLSAERRRHRSRHVPTWDKLQAGAGQSETTGFRVESICDCVVSNEPGRIEDYFRSLERHFLICAKELDQIKICCINLYISLRHHFCRGCPDFGGLLRDSEAISREIYDGKVPGDVLGIMRRECETIATNLSDTSNSNVIYRVAKYIRQHYDSDIKLEMLGDMFGYNSAYLGKLFHCTMAESFNAYLDRVRIDEAKKLLLSGEFRVYEIAQKVGYKSVDYFYGKFKAYVGCSPKAFIRSSLAGGGSPPA